MHYFILTVVLLLSVPTHAQIAGRLYLGECRLYLEPIPKHYTQIWPNLCFQNAISTHYTGQGILETKTAQARDVEQQEFYQVDSYLGLNLWHFISFHGQVQLIKDKSDRWTPVNEGSRNIPELLFLQLGNPLLHKHRASIGIVNAPFGLNDKPLDAVLRTIKQNYWQEQQHGIILSKSSGNNAHYELGVNLHEEDSLDETFKKGSVRSLASRISLDLAALEGSKLVASQLLEKHSFRQYGFAFLNHDQGATTSIEWIRRYPNDRSKAFMELFRLNFLSRRSKYFQMLMQYEDDRRVHWIWSTQGKLYPIRNTEVNLTLSHRKSRMENTPSTWILSLGSQVTF